MIRTVSKKLDISRARTQKPHKTLQVTGDERQPSAGTWLGKRAKDFCAATALHGYGHVIREDTALWERITWLVICFAALIIAVVLLWISWNWNAETPTVTVIESTHFATWNIPFPAVTICNLNRISNELALARATEMERPRNMSAEELSKLFRFVLSFQGVSVMPPDDYLLLHEVLQINKVTVSQLAKALAPKCVDMLDRCMWKGSQTRCDTLFQPIWTIDGVCCAFNYLALSKQNYPPKIAQNVPKEPRRVTACGYTTGLSVLLHPQLADYHSTTLSAKGFRVFIHNSYDFPDDNAETKVFTSQLETFLSVSPESTYSTPDVFKLPIAERQCVSAIEMPMNVFQKYSYVNCMAECRAELAFQMCGCVPFYLPNNGSLPFCEMHQLKCIMERKGFLFVSLPGVNQTIFQTLTTPASACNCLPDCQLVQYPSEVSHGHFTREFSFNAMAFFKDVTIADHSLVHVFFNDLVSTRYRKDMSQNWLTVLATFGGILGLFLGFSLVTGFELIYFFTVRVLFDQCAGQRKRLTKTAPS